MVHPRGANRVESVVPACDAAGATQPCWQIVPNAAECSDVAGNLAMDIDRGGNPPPPSDAVLEVRCAADE